MEKTRNLWVLLGLFSISLMYVSCGDDEGTGSGPGDNVVMGCTDSEAVNYNADATEDSGDCVYERDAFIGEYLGSFTCDDILLAGVLNSDSLNFEIKLPVDDSDKSLVIFSMIIEGLPVDLESRIVDNTLTISDTIRNFMIPDVDIPIIGSTTVTADVIGNGTATLPDEDTLDGSIDLTMDISDPSIPGLPSVYNDNCILIGRRK